MSITYVKPEGDLNTAKYIIVGEQPGKTEVWAKRPFKGPAGRMLDECLIKARISRSECYLTNVIKDLDHPLNYYYVSGSGDPYFTKAGAEHTVALKKELSVARPGTVIIAVGNVAMWALCERIGITSWRGSILDSIMVPGLKVVPVIHTATVIPPKNVYSNKLLIQFDMTKAKRVSVGDYNHYDYNLITGPTFENTVYCLEQASTTDIVDFDIEVHPTNEEITCISLSFVPHTYADGHSTPCDRITISIPFIDSNGSYFTIEQEATIWGELAALFENPHIKKRGQNIAFDSHFILRKYGICIRPLDDTMIAQRTIMPEYPIGLDFITSIWTDHPYYKKEGKKYFSGGNWVKLWKYNCTDSLICSEAFPKQFKDVVRQGNEEAYNRQVKLVEPLVYMMERGIKIDVEGMAEAYDSAEIEIAKMKLELNEMVGKELNANSPKQLAQYFYIDKGLKAYKHKGKITTNENAMIRVARRGYPEAFKVLDIRRAVKNRSTYLNVDKVDTDGRMRCSYNPVGTKFSRISSSKNIFGTGNNLQNQPHDILRYFLIDDGYIGYTLDLSQAENRIVAYLGKVMQMIEAFESGKDVHSLTGSLISNLSYEEVIRQHNENVFCAIGSSKKTWRYYGKQSNHGLNYDEGYKTFSLDLEIPEREGKYIVERYHMAYPGIRQTFHTKIRSQLAKNRTITNLMGRRTLLLDKWGDKLFKVGYDCIPQGTVGDIINERGIEYIYYNQDMFAPIEMLTQVHDSIDLQVPLDVPLKDHAEMLIKTKQSLEIPLETGGMKFVIPADLTVGHTLRKEDGIEIKGKDFSEDVDELADRLEDSIRRLS